MVTALVSSIGVIGVIIGALALVLLAPILIPIVLVILLVGVFGPIGAILVFILCCVLFELR